MRNEKSIYSWHSGCRKTILTSRLGLKLGIKSMILMNIIGFLADPTLVIRNWNRKLQKLLMMNSLGLLLVTVLRCRIYCFQMQTA